MMWNEPRSLTFSLSGEIAKPILTNDLARDPCLTAQHPVTAHPILCLVNERETLRHTKPSKAIWTPIGLPGIILPGFAPSVATGLLAAGGVRLQQERPGGLVRRCSSGQLIITLGVMSQNRLSPLFLASEREKPALSPFGWLSHSLF